MTQEISKEYLEKVLKIQTGFTYNLVNKLGEELFPGNGAKLLVLHSIVEDGLRQIHASVAASLDPSLKQT